MNRELLIKTLIKRTGNFVIGGYENAIEDGTLIEKPDKQGLLQEIYIGVIHENRLAVSGGFIPVKKDIRFVGKERIIELIDEWLDKNNTL